MATLYERLTGINLPFDPSGPDEERIPIHPFMSAVFEYRRGILSQAEIIELFDLTEQQVTDSESFFTVLNLAIDVNQMERVVKDWLYLAEYFSNTPKGERFDSAAKMFARMQQEITRQTEA